MLILTVTETIFKDNELHNMKTECKNLVTKSSFHLQVVQTPVMETSDDPEDEDIYKRTPCV